MNDIDSLLREDARATLADNGFSERVMHALPHRRASRATAWRPVLVMGSAMVGSLLAVMFAPGSVLAGFSEIAMAQFTSPAALAALALPATLLVSALVVAFDAD